MKDWRKILVKKELSLLEAMKVIDVTAHKFVLVVDEKGLLLGSLSDGDIRRALIAGKKLTSAISESMNVNPISVSGSENRRELIRMMQKRVIQYAPMIDKAKKVTGVCVLSDLLLPQKRENPVVLMAGGPGTRLGNLTENTPKPMLKLGDKPILQLIIENFRDQGFSNFYISVNYLAEQIENYFGEGEKYGVQIRYLREDKRLGTAGSLSLIEEVENIPHVVMNADIFSQMHFDEIVDYFDECKFDALMCVRQHDIQVPFGVVRTDGKYIQGIDEKPVQSFFVNAGVYVLSPKLIQMVPKNQYYDMTHLFDDAKTKNFQTGIFPIHGFWRDLGSRSDLQGVQAIFEKDKK